MLHLVCVCVFNSLYQVDEIFCNDDGGDEIFSGRSILSLSLKLKENRDLENSENCLLVLKRVLKDHDRVLKDISIKMYPQNGSMSWHNCFKVSPSYM